jgi:hypothetical protein
LPAHLRSRWSLLTVVIVVVALLMAWVGMRFWKHDPGPERAMARAQAFVEVINGNKPAEVYAFLDPTVTSLATKEQFVHNWQVDREYPYISPLWLYIDEITLSSDERSGRATCTVAARLPGMKRTFELVWSHGDYYMIAFREIADGSFPITLHRLTPQN